MVTINEHTAVRYVVHEVPYGKTYAWCPGFVTLECDCGEKAAFTCSAAICGWCGADHTAIIREKLAIRERLGDEELHPWRYGEHPEGGGLPV